MRPHVQVAKITRQGKREGQRDEGEEENRRETTTTAKPNFFFSAASFNKVPVLSFELKFILYFLCIGLGA